MMMIVMMTMVTLRGGSWGSWGDQDDDDDSDDVDNDNDDDDDNDDVDDDDKRMMITMMMTFWTSAPNQKVTGANTLPRIDVKENIALTINMALFSKGFRLVIPALSYKKEKT